MNHALGYDVQQVYLVTLAAKLAQGPVDHHLAVRRAVDREQDLAQRRGMFGLVRGGHLGPGGERGVSRRTGRFVSGTPRDLFRWPREVGEGVRGRRDAHAR
jgi:hypothetical protein